MSLNGKLLSEILETVEKNFICLRCAECCYRWAVPLPDGTKKEENQKCPYLSDLSVNDNQWTEAYCKIYKNRPEVCQNFKISFATICPIGLWKWLKIKENNSDIALPNRVEKILQFIKKF
ncbi:MAG: hypothetical protein RMI30_06440 [Thermodesulfovibrio sp.]|nr:YkgJ family cysteine cluster protein [Thermodesulfovibrio sp.]MDW7999069.1 hypothetical protein [Thermodesulfovibrio sp.]